LLNFIGWNVAVDFSTVLVHRILGDPKYRAHARWVAEDGCCRNGLGRKQERRRSGILQTYCWIVSSSRDSPSPVNVAGASFR